MKIWFYVFWFISLLYHSLFTYKIVQNNRIQTWFCDSKTLASNSQNNITVYSKKALFSTPVEESSHCEEPRHKMEQSTAKTTLKYFKYKLIKISWDFKNGG